MRKDCLRFAACPKAGLNAFLPACLPACLTDCLTACLSACHACTALYAWVARFCSFNRCCVEVFYVSLLQISGRTFCSLSFTATGLTF